MGALPEPAVTLGEAQAFLRLETGEEEALAAGLIRSATQLCEAFIGQAVMARDFTLPAAATGQWERLAIAPVRTINAVEAVAADGTATPLSSAQYSIDIDAAGDGWVRVAPLGGARAQVSGTAGMASDPNHVPEAIRQGILRLAAHLFSNRDGPGGEPPAAVTALWRPYRRMRLS